MNVEPGEWQEEGGTPSLVVDQVDGTLIEIFVEDRPEAWPEDTFSESHLFAGILLTPDQARSVANKLLELADSIDEGK